MTNSTHAIPHMKSTISLLELHLNQELSFIANNVNNINMLSGAKITDSKLALLKTAKTSLDKMKIYADKANESFDNKEISSYVENLKKFYAYLSFIKPIILPTSILIENEITH